MTGPRPKLWRLIVPWKPLPIPIPDTFTRSPGSNCSTVSVSPICASGASSRNSTTVLDGGAPAFFRCPSSGLVSLRSSVAIAATWTAS